MVIATVMCCVNTRAYRSRLNSSPVQCVLTKVYRIPSVSGYQCSMTIATWLQVVDVFFSVSHSVMLLMAAMPDHFGMKPLKSWNNYLPYQVDLSNAQFMVQKLHLHVLQGRTICNRQQEVFVSRPFTVPTFLPGVKSRLNCSQSNELLGDLGDSEKHFLLNQPFLLGCGKPNLP